MKRVGSPMTKVGSPMKKVGSPIKKVGAPTKKIGSPPKKEAEPVKYSGSASFLSVFYFLFENIISKFLFRSPISGFLKFLLRWYII